MAMAAYDEDGALGFGGTLDVAFDDAFDETFDPLADAPAFVDDEDVDFPVGGGENLQLEGGPRVAPVPEHDPRPASERTAELFGRMAARRKTLLAILRHCTEQKPVFEVANYIEELKRSDRCVYSANDFTTLLERAGAIERVGADGTSYEEVELEPRTVTVDGIDYLEPQTPPPAFWLTTEAGRAQVAADDPATRMEKLFEDEGAYLPIYKRVLTLCSRADGASAKQLAKAIDRDELLRSPRYYASRFVEKLNEAEALTWDAAGKVWRISESGVEALGQLADVEDAPSDAIAAGDQA